YSRTCLRWLTPLLTMGSFFRPKYGFCPDNLPPIGRRTLWFNMMIRLTSSSIGKAHFMGVNFALRM
ncbi:hypothetical protein QUA31_27100, partial [Microcoleus sp. Pol14D5]